MVATAGEISAFEAYIFNASNFTVQIDGYKWLVHSNVLSKQSKFFEKACNGNFKESEEKIITLHEDCPWIVATMIRWFYRPATAKIRDILADTAQVLGSMMAQGKLLCDFEEVKDQHGERQDWQIHLLLHQIADKYEILELKKECAEILKCALKNDFGLFMQMNEFMGNAFFRLEKEVCRAALEDAWHKHSARDVCNWWGSVFCTDTDMMGILQESMCAELDIRKATVAEALVAIETAQQSTKEASYMMKYPENQSSHEKIYEAVMILYEVRKTLGAI